MKFGINIFIYCFIMFTFTSCVSSFYITKCSVKYTNGCVNDNDCLDTYSCINHECSLSSVSPVPAPQPSPSSGSINIKVVSGNKATLTYFTDTVFQCVDRIPSGNALAVNPLLLGFTEQEWSQKFVNAPSSDIPWCNKQLKVTVGTKSFTGVIIDTCDPVGNPFSDPNTGLSIGGKCDYPDAIDLYGPNGLAFLQSINNDDFYQGPLQWELV
jgi:hypothetical protein